MLSERSDEGKSKCSQRSAAVVASGVKKNVLKSDERDRFSERKCKSLHLSSTTVVATLTEYYDILNLDLLEFEVRETKTVFCSSVFVRDSVLDYTVGTVTALRV